MFLFLSTSHIAISKEIAMTQELLGTSFFSFGKILYTYYSSLNIEIHLRLF